MTASMTSRITSTRGSILTSAGKTRPTFGSNFGTGFVRGGLLSRRSELLASRRQALDDVLHRGERRQRGRTRRLLVGTFRHGWVNQVTEAAGSRIASGVCLVMMFKRAATSV